MTIPKRELRRTTNFDSKGFLFRSCQRRTNTTSPTSSALSLSLSSCVRFFNFNKTVESDPENALHSPRRRPRKRMRLDIASARVDDVVVDEATANIHQPMEVVASKGRRKIDQNDNVATKTTTSSTTSSEEMPIRTTSSTNSVSSIVRDDDGTESSSPQDDRTPLVRILQEMFAQAIKDANNPTIDVLAENLAVSQNLDLNKLGESKIFSFCL